jgi:hypothetical protein
MTAIAIDCDGVLADFTHAFGEMANRVLGDNRYKDGWQPGDWNFGGLYTAKEQSKVWKAIRTTDNFWLTLRAYQDNVSALVRWVYRNPGADVWIVTSRAETAGMTVAKQTAHWLHMCSCRDINGKDVTVVPVTDSDDKWKIYEAMEIGYSIDDKAETVEQCDAMLDHRPIPDGRGKHRAYLLDRPWNQDAKVNRRIGSVADYLKEII